MYSTISPTVHTTAAGRSKRVSMSPNVKQIQEQVASSAKLAASRTHMIATKHRRTNEQTACHESHNMAVRGTSSAGARPTSVPVSNGRYGRATPPRRLLVGKTRAMPTVSSAVMAAEPER